jgi:hypothetical protein
LLRVCALFEAAGNSLDHWPDAMSQPSLTA